MYILFEFPESATCRLAYTVTSNKYSDKFVFAMYFNLIFSKQRSFIFASILQHYIEIHCILAYNFNLKQLFLSNVDYASNLIFTSSLYNSTKIKLSK